MGLGDYDSWLQTGLANQALGFNPYANMSSNIWTTASTSATVYVDGGGLQRYEPAVAPKAPPAWHEEGDLAWLNQRVAEVSVSL